MPPFTYMYTIVACFDGDVRLVDGDTNYARLVERCFNQRWGTVNGDGWSNADSQGVCKQLGYLSTGGGKGGSGDHYCL